MKKIEPKPAADVFVPRPVLYAPPPDTRGRSYDSLGIEDWCNLPFPVLVRVSTGERLLINKKRFTIGRSKLFADYALPKVPGISLVYCAIIKKGFSCDFVNKHLKVCYAFGRKIKKGEKIQLSSGVAIDIGEEEFVLQLPREPVPKPEPKKIQAVRCENGHYYDPRKSRTCPFCRPYPFNQGGSDRPDGPWSPQNGNPKRPG